MFYALAAYLIVGLILAHYCERSDKKRGLKPSTNQFMNLTFAWPYVIYLTFKLRKK